MALSSNPLTSLALLAQAPRVSVNQRLQPGYTNPQQCPVDLYGPGVSLRKADCIS